MTTAYEAGVATTRPVWQDMGQAWGHGRIWSVTNDQRCSSFVVPSVHREFRKLPTHRASSCLQPRAWPQATPTQMILSFVSTKYDKNATAVWPNVRMKNPAIKVGVHSPAKLYASTSSAACAARGMPAAATVPAATGAPRSSGVVSGAGTKAGAIQRAVSTQATTSSAAESKLERGRTAIIAALGWQVP